MRLLTLALAALLVAVQAELWLGRSGVPRVVELQQRLAEQQAANAAATKRNRQLDAEVRDLKEGLDPESRTRNSGLIGSPIRS